MSVAQLAAGTDAAERIRDAQDFVARRDYEAAVRQVIEYEGKAHDLAARVRELAAEVTRAEDKLRQASAEAEQRILGMQGERDRALRDAAQHERDARRYREALEKAVIDVARLTEQVRELGAAVESGKKTGRLTAILAGVAAAVSVATYLKSEDEEPVEEDSPKARKKKGT